MALHHHGNGVILGRGDRVGWDKDTLIPSSPAARSRPNEFNRAGNFPGEHQCGRYGLDSPVGRPGDVDDPGLALFYGGMVRTKNVLGNHHAELHGHRPWSPSSGFFSATALLSARP